MANKLHFANLASIVSVPQFTSSSQVANLNGFGPIATVNTNGLGMRLSC